VTNDDWVRTLHRAQREGLLPAGELTVTLYDDGRVLHGSALCAPNSQETNVVLEETIRGERGIWCSCRSWQSTRLGSVLRAIALHHDALDDEAAGAVCRDWPSLWSRLVQADDTRALPHRGNDRGLLELQRRARRAHLAVAERSRAHLDEEDLEGRIAAQAVTVPVTADTAYDLVRWAQGKRLTAPPPDRRSATPRFDAILTDALVRAGNDGDLLLVGVRGNPALEGAVDHDLLPELALLLWWRRLDPRRTALLNLRRPVAEGLRAIAARSTRFAVAGHAETSPEVLETLRVLWEESGDDATIGDLLETARAL